jgi:hypothetical protein
MPNESKTERIVRTHFENFKQQIELEEKRSDTPKIDKLLKTASKKGGGKGFPEFIISFKTNSDLLAIVECKADPSKHESPNRDKYSEYAVVGGTCIAIVPMQCASAQKGKVLELKKQLLKRHTLEAVLSMPDELFFNSDVTVVSCVMIFTAHKPHPANIVSNKPYDPNHKIRLSLNGWQFFNLTQLFAISSTHDELPSRLPAGSLTPYVTSSELNNGITTYVDEESDFGDITITANRGGSVGYFFYQPMNYMATPVDVRILKPKFKINSFNAMFLCTILQMEKYRFNFSRKMGTARLKGLSIKLPAKEKEPDFEYM